MSADAKPYTVAEWTLARGNDALNYERMTATVRALEATKEELAHAYSDWEAETKYTAEQKAALDEAVKETNGILRKALSSKAYNAAWGPELEALGDIVDELVLARKAATKRAEAAEAALKTVDDWRGDVQARIDNGKGTWPKPGYVTDEVWSNWHERRATLDRVADLFARVLGGGR